MQGGGLQRPAGATLAEVEVLPRQSDDRLIEVDGVGRDTAWMAESGVIQAIWRRDRPAVRAMDLQVCIAEGKQPELSVEGEGGAIQAIWRPSSLDYNPGYLAATASRGSRSAARLQVCTRGASSQNSALWSSVR